MSEFGHNRVTLGHLRKHLPMVWRWVWEQEQFILANGVSLTPSQTFDARRAGVVHPKRVRLLGVELIPTPAQLVLREVAAALNFITPASPGLAMRYGIFIRSDYWCERQVLVLQLAHTAQYERLGGIPAFLECNLHERLLLGAESSPMEQEAISVARRICDSERSLGTAQTIRSSLPKRFDSCKK